MKQPLWLSLSLVLTACAGAPRSESTPVDLLDVGSEANGRVAIEDPAGLGELVYLTSEWDEEEHQLLEGLAPNVRFVSGLSAEQRLARAGEFHGADAHLLTPEFLAAADQLRWVQSHSAGVDRYMNLDELTARDEVVLTNMKGVHGPVIAEHVMGMLLSSSRALPAFQRAQDEGRWDRRAGSGQRVLAGSTLLVVGMGGIGTEVARRAHAFDMTVLATVRSPRPAPEFVAELGTATDLSRFLALADVVVICLPLTEETRGLFDAERLAEMRDDALLINIGRGPIIDTDALVDALERDQLGGACLDVTDPEPLPAGHPLWSREDVIITPHTASAGELTGRRRAQLFHENVRRFAAGEPLLNVVDKTVGY